MSIGSSQIKYIFPLTSHTIPPQYKLFLGRCRGLLPLGPKHGLIGMPGENQASAEALMTLCINPAVRPHRLQNPSHKVTRFAMLSVALVYPQICPLFTPSLFLVQPHRLFFPRTIHPMTTPTPITERGSRVLGVCVYVGVWSLEDNPGHHTSHTINPLYFLRQGLLSSIAQKLIK